MEDVKAVVWLPLDEAIERLSRGYERAFLANVGPLALQAAVAEFAPSKTKQPALDNQRGRQSVAPQPSSGISVTAVATYETAEQVAEADITASRPESPDNETVGTIRGPHRTLIQKMRDWLRRAA